MATAAARRARPSGHCGGTAPEGGREGGVAGGGGGKPRRFRRRELRPGTPHRGQRARRGPVALQRGPQRGSAERGAGGGRPHLVDELLLIGEVGVPDVRLHLRGWRREWDHARGSGERRAALWMVLPLDPDPGARAAPAELGLGLLRARRRPRRVRRGGGRTWCTRSTESWS